MLHLFAALAEKERAVISMAACASAPATRPALTAAQASERRGLPRTCPVSAELAKLAKRGFLNERERPFNHKSIATMLVPRPWSASQSLKPRSKRLPGRSRSAASATSRLSP